MSPPIYTPDGSEVSEIVLPDGSTASQVIGPDGNVVFEAGPDIPDSPVTQLKIDEGSGSTTLNDSIGSNAADITNVSWESNTDVVGGTWIKNGSVYADIEPAPDQLSSDPNNAEFSLAVTAYNLPSILSNRETIFLGGDASYPTQYGMHALDSGNELNFGEDDTLDTHVTISTSDIPSGFVRIVAINDNGSLDMFFNADNSNVSSGGDIISADKDLDRVRFGNRWDSDGSDYRYDNGLDNVILYDTALSQSQIDDDYALQPWS